MMQTRMWARAQRDGRPAEYRWCSRFKAAKFGGRALLVYRGVTLPTRLKPAARSSLQIQDEKNRQEVAIWALSRKFVGLYLCN